MYSEVDNERKSSVGLKFNYGMAESVSTQEMIISHATSSWKEVFTFNLGRFYGIRPARVKDVLFTYIQRHEQPFFYREWPDGTAVAYNEMYVLHCRLPNRSSQIPDTIRVIGGNPSADTFFEVHLYGAYEATTESTAWNVTNKLRENIRNAHDQVTWMYNDGHHLDEAVFPIKNYRPILPEAYPFIPNLDQWIRRFIESDSNVLILNGPMGTGKSALIGHMIKQGQFSTMTAFDDKVMKNDSLYTMFISYNYNLLVLEDADLLLLGRVDKENDTMSKLLNVSEGIINTKGKKIIFTANLGNTKDIDAALLRPGRCFDIVEFRELTLNEANAAREKLGKRPFAYALSSPNRTYSLAEIYQKE